MILAFNILSTMCIYFTLASNGHNFNKYNKTIKKAFYTVECKYLYLNRW